MDRHSKVPQERQVVGKEQALEGNGVPKISKGLPDSIFGSSQPEVTTDFFGSTQQNHQKNEPFPLQRSDKKSLAEPMEDKSIASNENESIVHNENKLKTKNHNLLETVETLLASEKVDNLIKISAQSIA